MATYPNRSFNQTSFTEDSANLTEVVDESYTDYYYFNSWIFSENLDVVLCCFCLTLNPPIIALFIRLPHLRSCLAVYVTFLAGCNILQGISYLLVVYLSFFLQNISDDWDYCVFYVYFREVLLAMPLQMHALIALSRLWALSFPAVYERLHTPALAWILSLATAAATNLIYLPFILWDRFFSLEESSACGRNIIIFGNETVTAFWAALQIMVHNVPMVFILVSYPPLFWLYRREQRRKEKLIEKQAELLNCYSVNLSRRAFIDAIYFPKEQQDGYTKTSVLTRQNPSRNGVSKV
ncbi:uncharacterized protein LOC129596514 isoform X2 [Paramacrobiotus metropolitanus]|uniref:uncharacterized protein LOC129596514 isoform X2 n=1 Tax=Paramacrobiotus metropolitanus TaxID=2943436 RepID=UPI0024460213|nr:uncharacterized protein LOC129596514 isoform X2 [Paramacrobiotus metropolitanus]